MSSTRPDWIKTGKVKYIVQYGPENEPGAGKTPNVMDLLTKEDDKLLLKAAIAPLALGRPYIAPPGVPADRVELLQKAMMATFNDPEFLAEAAKAAMDISPATGEASQKIAESIVTAPPDVIARAKQLMTP